MTRCAPQSEDQTRPSCQRDDSPNKPCADAVANDEPLAMRAGAVEIKTGGLSGHQNLLKRTGGGPAWPRGETLATLPSDS